MKGVIGRPYFVVAVSCRKSVIAAAVTSG